jgi:hypothetical protein
MDRQSKVVQEEKLQFQLIKLSEGETSDLNTIGSATACVLLTDGDYAYLGISRVGVEYIGEELACHGDTSDDQSMDVIGVNHERPPRSFSHKLAHPIKVHQQRQEHLVRRWTVLQDPEEVCLERDRGDVPRMEGKRCGARAQ